ncbi:MAG: M14 family zinc carboxypeptidase [Pseudonocardiaceae bacterium]
MMPPPYPQLTVPLTPAQIEDALADLSASFPTLCTLEAFPNKSVEGRDIHFIKIANGTGSDRPRVVFLGGVHARESAPPDALIRFAQNVLASQDSGTDIVSLIQNPSEVRNGLLRK